MSLKLTAIRIYKNIVIRLILIFNPIWPITDDDYISIKDQLLIIYIFEFEIGLYRWQLKLVESMFGTIPNSKRLFCIVWN